MKAIFKAKDNHNKGRIKPAHILKFNLTTELADYLNGFCIFEDISIEHMLNWLLCVVMNDDPLGAARVLLWFFRVTTYKLTDEQTAEVALSFIMPLLSCVADGAADMDTTLEVVSMCYAEAKSFNVDIKDQIKETNEIEVNLVPEAMNFIKLHKRSNMTVEQVLLERIEDLMPVKKDTAFMIMTQRLIDATSNQSYMKVNATILILSGFLLNYIDTIVPIEQSMKGLRKVCAENIENADKYQYLKEVKALIYG